jgi:hypothetical protein
MTTARSDALHSGSLSFLSSFALVLGLPQHELAAVGVVVQI